METIRRNRRITLITFLLSLLFHASFMIYLLWQKTDSLNTALPEEELQRAVKKEEDQWAETKARASNFGAPVFFEDEPQPETPDTPEKEETPEQEESSVAKAEFILSSVEGADRPETKAPELERTIDIPSSFAEATADREEIIAQLPPQQETTTIQRPRRTRQPREKKEQPVMQRQPQKPAPQPQRQPNTPSPKQLPTLAQLTQGFLHQAKDEGNHAIHMLGNRKGLPTDEQMKYERYLQKLNWCLQNSFNINNNRYPQSERIETEVHLFLALDKDGKIKQLNVAKSTGSRQLDQFVLFVFRDASSSFPPVPQYLPHNPFTIMYTVMLNSTDNNFRVYRR